jgi:hypothetical protein
LEVLGEEIRDFVPRYRATVGISRYEEDERMIAKRHIAYMIGYKSTKMVLEVFAIYKLSNHHDQTQNTSHPLLPLPL